MPPIKQTGTELVLLEEASADRRQEWDRVLSNPVSGANPDLASTGGKALDFPPSDSADLQSAGLQGETCEALGPFDDVFKAQQLSKQLASLGIGLRVRAVDKSEQEFDYRLLIPPMNSPEEAFRKLRELQASGIDSYVITAGEHALGISLGVYSSDSGAESARKRFEADGYETQMVKMTRTSRSYWLFSTKGSSLGLHEISYQKLIADNPQVKVTRMLCE